jgi:hypothetical protein
MEGIYCYTDTLNNAKVIYVGKDSYIEESRRHKEHLWNSRRYKQPINQTLQNNKDRYQYKVLVKGNIKEKILNGLEQAFIRRYNPKFNFTVGGDGSKGHRFTDEQKKKLSEIHKGQTPWNKGSPNCFNHTDKAKEKIRKAQTGKGNSMYGKTPWNKGITGKDSHMYKDYYRLVKDGKQGDKQLYSIIKNKKRLKKSVDINKLITWFKENHPNEKLQGDLI